MPMPLPPFDFDRLRSFVAVIDNGSFTRAAERMGLTQSTVSLQIKKLEQDLGRPVILRQHDGRRGALALTPDGEILLPHARQILRLGEEARAQIMARDVAGRVRLGTPEDFATYYLPDVLARFGRAHPHVLLEVNCDFTLNLLDGYGKGLYDLVLFKRDLQQSLAPAGAGIEVWRESLVWVASPRWFPPEPGASLPLVLAPAPDIYRKRALAALEAAARPARVAFASPSLAGLQAAVRAGLGVTILPRGMVPADLIILDRDKHGLPALQDAEIVLYTAPGKGHAAAEKLAADIIQSLRQYRGG